jgi:hypothetical protein
MPIDHSAIQFDGDRPQLPTISAQAGLPFYPTGGAHSVRQNADQSPRKADIASFGGKGGGAESGGEFDPGSGGFGNG